MQNNEISTEGNNNTSVYAIIDSSFEIKLPKTLNLSKVTKSADYTITMTGDISGDRKVSVVPDESFFFSQINKDDVLATVEQEKQFFSGKELVASSKHQSFAYGTVSAPDLTGGCWEGSFNFTILCENVAKKSIGDYSCQVVNNKAFLTRYNGSDENVVVPATLTADNGEKYQTYFSDHVFENNRNIKTVAFEDGIYADDGIKNAFSRCSSLVSADLSNLNLDLCRHIDNLFNGCSSLQTIEFGNNTLPNLLSTSYTFSGCSILTSLDVSSWNMSELEDDTGMFQSTRKLATLKLPEYVNRLDDFMFNHADAVVGESFTIPKGVKYIGTTHVFYNFGVQNKFTSFEMQDGDTDSVVTTYGGDWKNYKCLYTADMKRLVAVPSQKNDFFPTFWMPEGVEDMNALSFSRNQNICGVRLPDTFVIKQTSDNAENKGTNLHVGIYTYCTAYYYFVKDTNPNYASLGGCIYSKDMTKLIAVPYKYAGAAENDSSYSESLKNKILTIPEGVTEIGEDAIYVDGMKSEQTSGNVCYMYNKIIIPSTLVTIPDDQFDIINYMISKYNYTVEIAEGNTAFELVNNQLVRK